MIPGSQIFGTWRKILLQRYKKLASLERKELKK